MSEIFNNLGISENLISALQKQNITIPTEIQTKVIPQALENKDLIVQSETGTGKTLAFLLPLFEKIKDLKKEMSAIILVPTHELAIQIIRQIELLATNSGMNIAGTPIIGNVNILRQIDKLKERPQIIVGSPGRILELIKKKKITAHTIKTIILDEADRLLDENNIKDVLAIVKTTMKDRQLMIYSASITQKTIAKSKDIMKEPIIIKSVEKLAVPNTIEHLYFVCEKRDKIEVLRKLVGILNPQKAIVFANVSNQIEILKEKLNYHKIPAEAIHGTNKKFDRKKAMDDFKSGKIKLLIASDLAARGLDITGVTHIFNLDMPEHAGDYLHRVGRTGRNGNSGIAVSIAAENEIPLIAMYEKDLKINIAFKDMYEGKVIEGKKKPNNSSQTPLFKKKGVK